MMMQKRKKREIPHTQQPKTTYDPVTTLLEYKNQRSRQEVQNISRQGGIKSGKVRRLKRDFKTVSQSLLDTNVSISQNDFALLKKYFPNVNKNEIDNILLIVVNCIKQARAGNLKAAELLVKMSAGSFVPKDLFGAKNRYTGEVVIMKWENPDEPEIQEAQIIDDE